jgi:hypothetical protein
MPKLSRRVLLDLVIGVAVLAIAIPVFAASPSASPSASSSPSTAATPSPAPAAATAEPSKAPKADKAPKEKKAKTPEVAVSLRGTVAKGTDEKGRPSFSVTVSGKVWQLSAGPAWYWGDKNPLAAFVGKTVTIAGSHHEGETEVDVETVDGTALREPGKPPWAGGPWRVGASHPGWKSWMAEGKPGRGLGREDAPGQLKKESPAP